MKDYKKILEDVVNIINTTEKSDIGFANICTYIGENCPQLKESEDEKSKKWILEYLHDGLRKSDEQFKDHFKAAIAWLEKQGRQEQDPCDNCKDVRLNCHNFPCVKKRAFKQGKSVLEVIKEDGEIITYSETDGYKLVGPKFKIGDTMRTLQEASNGITSGLPVIVSIDNEYYHCNNELIAIKNQDNYEYPPMNRRQKSSWSEEDKKTLERVIRCIENHDYMNVDDIHWFKSLKDRVGCEANCTTTKEWKPSDEQLDALQYVYRNLNPPLTDKLGWDSLKTLELLYQDLKKLK